MALEKMTITAYEDDSFRSSVGDPFTVWINPATYTHTHSICYNDRRAPGSNGGSPAFNRIGASEISFDLIFDATGAVPAVRAGVDTAPQDGISGLLSDFKKLTLNYNGEIHSPNFVKISWAQLQFQCRLKQLSVVYTLFKPDGTPLRAKATVTFVGYTSEEMLAKEAKKSSPDLTHSVTVVAGDTLPMLCYRIYGSCLPYLQVARVNGLCDFRNLVPGSELIFPPLAEDDA